MAESTVSGRHCVVTQHAGGRCTVRDLSRNGTRIAGRRLVPNVETEVAPGQAIEVAAGVSLFLSGPATRPDLEDDIGGHTVAATGFTIATVLVGDIRDYTTMVRQAPPLELQQSVGRVFERLTQQVLQYGGTVKEYQGDAIFAFWEGSADGRQAVGACRAALAFNELAERLAADRAVWDVPGFSLGLDWALATGPVVIDAIGGASQRAGLSIIGEAVVRAFRLEKFATLETGPIVACETTCQMAAGHFTFRSLGERQAKGFRSSRPCLRARRGEEGTQPASSGGAMRIRIVPSALGGGQDLEFLTTFVVNGTVAIDAGALGFWGDLDAQRRVDHVFLSHSHADHLGSLPMFVANTLDGRSRNVVVHAEGPVLDSLSRDVFNGRLWPDFLRSRAGRAPLLDLAETSGAAVTEVNGVRITTIPVPHPVPTVAHIVDDGTSAVVISTDSAPTVALWREAARIPTSRRCSSGRRVQRRRPSWRASPGTSRRARWTANWRRSTRGSRYSPCTSSPATARRSSNSCVHSGGRISRWASRRPTTSSERLLSVPPGRRTCAIILVWCVPGRHSAGRAGSWRRLPCSGWRRPLLPPFARPS